MASTSLVDIYSWFINTDATHHITFEAYMLQNAKPYTVEYSFMLGNSLTIHITLSGSSFLSISS